MTQTPGGELWIAGQFGELGAFAFLRLMRYDGVRFHAPTEYQPAT